jgi:hypothetical protein
MGADRFSDQVETGRTDEMGIFLNEKGAGKFSVYIFFIFLFLVIHAGIKVVPMYMDFERMKDEMSTKAGLAQFLKDEEIRTDLVRKAKDLDLPLTDESFVLQRDAERRRMKISTQWDVEVNFLWGAYIRTFHFEPAVDENFMNVKL